MQLFEADDSRERVFDALFAAHFLTICRYAQRRLPEASMGEDVAAETFAAAWQRIAAGDDIGLPWLYTVASRRITDHYRERERWAAIEADLARAAERSADSRHPLELLALRDVLAALSERQREVVLLHYWDGCRVAEIATIVGATQASVKMTLSRARATMRSLLSDADESAELVEEGERHD